MWPTLLMLLVSVGSYFWDIGIDVIIGRQQFEKTFPEHKFGGRKLNERDIKSFLD